jgi:hypothetical protein
MINQFVKFIREYKSLMKISSESDAFAVWYAQMRSSSGHRVFTDKGDGGIDLVITTNSEVILCQLKFGKADIDEVRAFAKVRQSWETAEGFDQWIAGVTNSQAKTAYRQAFRAAGSRTLVWEFVCLNEDSGSWRRTLTAGSAANTDCRLVSKNDILYYFSLDKMGATYVNPLRVRAAQTALNDVTRTEFGEIKTLVCMVRVSSLLFALRKSNDWERVLSRNVRVRRTRSSVNEGIQQTYQKEPVSFFYGNNGLHILATAAHLSGDELYAEQPAIINGGQTVSSLMELGASGGSEANVLTRVTVIPKEVQMDKECESFIEKIIVRSNSNNRMQPWDLRSNDEIQVNLARALFRHKIYYERKVNEWDVYTHIERPYIHLRLDICDLAEILACCSESYGPVKYRAHGLEPIFENSKTETYKKIFSKTAVSKIDETVSMIRLDDSISKAIKTIGRSRFGVFSAFPRSAKNFLLANLWMHLRDDGITHPFPEHAKLPAAWDKAINSMINSLFEKFKADLRNGVSMNDVFRTEHYWMKCKNTISARSPAYGVVLKHLREAK